MFTVNIYEPGLVHIHQKGGNNKIIIIIIIIIIVPYTPDLAHEFLLLQLWKSNLPTACSQWAS